MNANFKIIK